MGPLPELRNRADGVGLWGQIPPAQGVLLMLTQGAVMLALGRILEEIRGTWQDREQEESYGNFTDFWELRKSFEDFVTDSS
jgi:hypothetical protein